MAGQLVGILNGFDLAIGGGRSRLQALQLASIRCHIFLLLGDGLEQSIVSLFLRGRGQAAVR
ncbi:hypothetical protein D3C84_1145420 [compost metagenome]